MLHHVDLLETCQLTLCKLHHPKQTHQFIHWNLLHLYLWGTCIDDVFVSSYALMAKHVTLLNIKLFCFKLLHHIDDDPFWSLSFLSMNIQYTTVLGYMSLKDVTKHFFTMMIQQTCLPQINGLSVFTEVDKLLQPTRSGVMEFMTWCLHQFSEAARVCFLCHCISTLIEKEIPKIKNEYVI